MRNCPVCQHYESSDLLDLEYALFDDLNLSGSVKVVQCHQCGMAYNRSVLTESDYLDYYSKNDYYMDTISPGSGGFSESEQSRYQYILELIEPHLGAINPIVIDFGCGKGGMLQWLGTKQRQWQLCGIEANHACRRFIAKYLEFSVYSSLSEVQKKADVIILSHVIEHLFCPNEILAELGQFCHAKTIIYIEAPLSEDYLSTPVDWQQLYFEHINHFGTQSLPRLLNSCAFNVLLQDKIHFLPSDPKSPLSIVFLVTKDVTNRATSFIEKEITLNRTIPCQEVMEKIRLHSKPISIWGVSQYTQLLLGTYPELRTRIKFLFDTSVAKIGRTIRGLKVDSPEKLSCLGKSDLLLLPKGKYTGEMLQLLNRINYEGEIIHY